MQFARIENLWSLLVLLPMLGAYLWWWRWKLRLMDRLGDRDLLQAMAHTQSARRQIARAVFALLGTALLCIAYAQPQWGQTNRPIKRTGVDVVFALDLSASMSARDVAPNRLEAAKNEIETALEVLRGDRVGLVVFTAISFVQTPLTTDYGAIRFYLDRLQPGQMPLGGTSLEGAMTDAVELLTGKRLQEEEEKSDIEMRRAKNQIVVLITDGEDHESDPRAAASLAATSNIKIVTVGFGSEDGERIPLLRPDGQLSGFKRDKSGEFVKTRLDRETLEQLAEATGGEYVPYTGENSVANALVDYINALEKTEIETMLKERYRERFQFFALPGLLLLLLSLLFGERRPRRRKSAASVALVSALLLLPGCERAFEDTLSSVDRGNELIEAGEFEQALEAYRQAETEIPARPELHYDIGRALLGLERWDEAAGSFARALETNDISLRFDALNNLGLSHAGREGWKDAWQTFSEALVLASQNPGVVEQARIDETRHNLEVAWRKFYPPCKQLEDTNEENDDPKSATTLEQPSVKDATLCGLDDDWYVIGAIPGSTVSVTATFRDLREEPDKDVPFLSQSADLQIALFDETGQTALAVDQGSEPPGDDRSATRTIARFLVDDTMTSDETGKLFLRVGAADQREFKYDVNIESIPPCHALEEQFEDNDDPEQAKAPGPGNHQMHHCGGDPDWFAIDVNEGDSIFVDVQALKDAERGTAPSLNVEIFDPDERLAAEGELDGQYLTAGVRDIAEPGRYLVHVFGQSKEEQGPYKLDIYQFAPCLEGDDRKEENDTAAAASPLDPGEPVVRYLRACDKDLDFFRVDFGDEKKVNVGLARATTPPPGIEPDELPPFQFDLVSASGDQILVPGAEVIEQPAPPQQAMPDGEAPPPQVPLELVVVANDLEGDSAILRVIGENEFYHLIQTDAQQQQQQDEDQQSDDKQDGDQDPEESDEKKEDEQGKDNQDAQDEQEGGDEQEEQKPNPDPKDPKDQTDEKPTPGEEAREGRLEDILEALEATDDNFQMRKALENMPGRYIEKDW